MSTVRGWLRRFGARAEGVRVLFTGLLHALEPLAGAVAPTGSVFGDALDVLGRLAAAAAARPRRCRAPAAVAVRRRGRRGSCSPGRSTPGGQHELTLGNPPRRPTAFGLADHEVIFRGVGGLMADRARQDHSGEHGRDVRADRAREVGLFRYALIREAADPALSTRQRGRLVRDLAAAEHAGPFGARVRVSRVTIDRWILVWRRGGFDALVPSARAWRAADRGGGAGVGGRAQAGGPGAHGGAGPRDPGRPAGSAPSERTLQRHFVRLELNTRPDGMPPRVFGRFEADARNERWTGDALHGPMIGGRKTYLFAFIDDHSRALVGYRWGHSEDTVRLEAALRAGLASRGIPRVVYLDNGSAMVSSQLLRALAILGITLTHSQPGQPAGRGKIERLFRTVREQFLVELAVPGALAAVGDLVRLNEMFTALGRDRLPPRGSTARPVSRRWNGSWPAAHRPCRPRSCCTRRSCGPSSGS